MCWPFLLKCRVSTWSGWHLPLLPASWAMLRSPWSSPGAPAELSTCPKRPPGRAREVDALGCSARLWRGSAGTGNTGAEHWVLLPTSPPCMGAHPGGVRAEMQCLPSQRNSFTPGWCPRVPNLSNDATWREKQTHFWVLSPSGKLPWQPCQGLRAAARAPRAPCW